MAIDFSPQEFRRRLALLLSQAVPETNDARRLELLTLADRYADVLRARGPTLPTEPRSFAAD
jgi:hypothetical protein